MTDCGCVCLLLGVCQAIVNTGVNVPSPGTPFPATAHTLAIRAPPAIPVSLMPPLFLLPVMALFSFSLFYVYVVCVCVTTC